MTHVNRVNFLSELESVTPGLSARETVEQGSCLVFRNGQLFTFNEEILCRRKSPLGDFEGAVPAKQLLQVLSKLTDEDLEIVEDEGGLLIKGKTVRSKVRIEKQTALNIDQVDQPEGWSKLGADFTEAITHVSPCSSREESQFVLTCVHIGPKYLEACDRFQVCRFPIETGLEKSTLVRAESLNKVVQCAVTEIALSKSWIHFRNASGLTFSCRRFLDDYVNLDAFLEVEGSQQVTLPGGVEEMVGKAEIFSSENGVGNALEVEIRSDVVQITGEGASGWLKERRKIDYGGPAIKFKIAPKLLLAITKKSSTCWVASNRLIVKTDKFTFISCTINPESTDKE